MGGEEATLHALQSTSSKRDMGNRRWLLTLHTAAAGCRITSTAGGPGRQAGRSLDDSGAAGTCWRPCFFLGAVSERLVPGL